MSFAFSSIGLLKEVQRVGRREACSSRMRAGSILHAPGLRGGRQTDIGTAGHDGVARSWVADRVAVAGCPRSC